MRDRRHLVDQPPAAKALERERVIEPVPSVAM
jgi:hypothetical protein